MDVQRELIQGQMDKARQRLRAAESLLRENFYEDAVSRAYYAIFHAARAALLVDGLEADSHSGLKNLFGLHLIKQGKLPTHLAKILSRTKDQRETSDYDVFSYIEQDDARQAVADAEEFVKAMEKYVERSYGADNRQ